MAAYAVDVPKGCGRLVYLVDDSKVHSKERYKWVSELGVDEVIYVPGEAACDEDVCPFAVSMTRVLQRVYPVEGKWKLPEHEVVCMLEAGQVGGGG